MNFILESNLAERTCGERPFGAIFVVFALGWLAFVVLLIMFAIPVHAQSSSAKSLPACSNPQMCFISKQAKSNWAAKHDCTFCAISEEQVSKIWSGESPSEAEALTKALNGSLKAYKLDTPIRLTQFFAQIRHETGASLSLEESFYYRPRALMSQWSKYFTKEEACKFGYVKSAKDVDYCKDYPKYAKKHDPDAEEIANHAYGGRYGNGDVNSGDGWKYHGRGMIMTTFHDNYKSAQDYYNKAFKDKPDVDLINHPELLKQMEYAVPAAAAFWVDKGLYKIADVTDTHDGLKNMCKTTNKISVIVNGGNNGKKERCAYSKHILKEGRFSLVDCTLPSADTPSRSGPLFPGPLFPSRQ